MTINYGPFNPPIDTITPFKVSAKLSYCNRWFQTWSL